MAGLGPGTIVDSRYKIVSRLGSGGMADVFLAEDEQLGRKVALKLLYQRFAEDPGFVERFRREAQAAAGLQHPNVVSVYDRGSYDGTYYIAMEYLPGRSLKQLIRAEAPLDPIRAIDITLQILKAARFAHRRGVIHRDLKPHNVIVDDSDNAKVTDFGIARAGASDMTETGSIMGTAQYLSPEQAQGHAVSAGSDLYSIGVVLYEMLTGRVPFDAESAVSIALKHVSEAPPPMTVFNPAVPAELEQVVMWALNKNPVDRPANADQFITALEQARTAIQSGERGQRTASMAALAGVAAGRYAATAAAGSGVAGGRHRRRGTGPSTTARTTGPVPPPDDEPPHRRRLWPWIVALLVLLLAGGGVAAYLILRPVKTTVPGVVGEDLNTARTQLQNAGFTVGSPIQVTSQQKAGIVIAQDPQGGHEGQGGLDGLAHGLLGPRLTAVPTLVGETLAQARSSLEIAEPRRGQGGARVEHPVRLRSGDRHQPDRGHERHRRHPGDAVRLDRAAVRAGARRHDRGRRSGQGHAPEPRVQRRRPPTRSRPRPPPGTVSARARPAARPAPSGSTVTLVVAKAPPTVAVPNVVGKTTGAANAALGAAGFPATQQQQTVTDKTPERHRPQPEPGRLDPGQEGDERDDRGRQVRRPDDADHHDHHDHADDVDDADGHHVDAEKKKK